MTSLIRWLARWPLHRAQQLGAVLGWLTWALSPTYRRHLQQHAAQAGLPRAVAREAVTEAGRMAAEAPWLWLRPHQAPLAPLLTWRGAERVDAALDEGRGLVLLTPHLGSFEACGRAIAERFGHRQPLTVLYRPARKAWLRELEETARHCPGMATAPANLAGVRQMLRALRRGEMVGLLPDQVPPEGQGVWAPFFGAPAYTMTLAARLVQQTGAEVLIAWCQRLAKGQGFVVHIEPLGEALPDARSPGDDPQSQAMAAAAINRAMARVILQCPSQYLWGYKRYKKPRRSAPAEASHA